MKKFLSYLGLAVLTTFSLMACRDTAFAFALPENHSCYDISKSELQASSPQSSAVDCLSYHNAETYRVAKWTRSQSPFALSEKDLLKVATSICIPWNLPSDTSLNYWSFYVPSSKDWNKGARWIRCDAMNTYKDTNGNSIFDSWKGVLSIPKKSLTKGSLLPSGETVFVYLEPNDGGCLGKGRLASGDIVSLVETNPQLNPAKQSSISQSMLYSREGGCGLGADFELKTSHHAHSGTVYDVTKRMVIGTIELTVDGNTRIYVSIN
jgi:hypothetical protein